MNNKMYIFKRVFLILLVLDLIGLIMTGIALVPTFKQLAEYGQVMMVVISVSVIVIVAIMLLEILAKIFLIRTTSSTFSWSSDSKGCIATANLLVLFNLGAVIVNLLSSGGEGATLLNQGYLYLRVLTSVAEIVAVVFYLRIVKKLFMDMKRGK